MGIVLHALTHLHLISCLLFSVMYLFKIRSAG